MASFNPFAHLIASGQASQAEMDAKMRDRVGR